MHHALLTEAYQLTEAVAHVFGAILLHVLLTRGTSLQYQNQSPAGLQREASLAMLLAVQPATFVGGVASNLRAARIQ